MIKARPSVSIIPALGLAVCLCACTTPLAGPNASATATVAPPPGPKPTLRQEAAAVADNKVEIMFPNGGATLTPEANRQLDLASRLFRDANPVVMFTTGYSDGRGDEYSNLLLSARRAEVVKRGLVARGIPADRLLIQAMGESDYADASNPLSPRNRRVTVTWRLI